jgi:hypothetical protein
MTFQVKTFYLASTLALSVSSASASASQVATDPGDYRPLPAGFDVAALYYQMTEHDKFYVDGVSIAGAPTLSTDIGLARWIHYIEVGGFLIDPQVVIPFGSVKLNGGGSELSASGVGDPLVGATIWLYNNTDTKVALAISAFVSIPLGSYDKEQGGINIGENRFKYVTQAAYIFPLSGSFSAEIIGEYTFFGDNDDFGGSDITLQQEAQYGVQTHLNYQMSQATMLSLSYYHDFGAESKVEGVKQNDELSNSRLQATVQHFLAPDLQVQVQYGRSISVENGFFEDSRVNLRLVKVF